MRKRFGLLVALGVGCGIAHGVQDGVIVGDDDVHEKVATRFGAHDTQRTEDRLSQPGTNSIETSQIRLTDGSIIFTPDLFGPGITVETLHDRMSSVGTGVKSRGFSVEAEDYGRWLSDFQGSNTAAILGHDGDGAEWRAGVTWYPLKKRGFRWNTEWIHLGKCPVGCTAVPYPVGGERRCLPHELRDERLAARRRRREAGGRR